MYNVFLLNTYSNNLFRWIVAYNLWNRIKTIIFNCNGFCSRKHINIYQKVDWCLFFNETNSLTSSF